MRAGAISIWPVHAGGEPDRGRSLQWAGRTDRGAHRRRFAPMSQLGLTCSVSRPQRRAHRCQCSNPGGGRVALEPIVAGKRGALVKWHTSPELFLFSSVRRKRCSAVALSSCGLQLARPRRCAPQADAGSGRAQNRIEGESRGHAVGRHKCEEAARNRQPLAASCVGCGGVQPAVLAAVEWGGLTKSTSGFVVPVRLLQPSRES